MHINRQDVSVMNPFVAIHDPNTQTCISPSRQHETSQFSRGSSVSTVPVLQTGRQGFSSRQRQELFTSYPRPYWLLNLRNFQSNGHKLIYYHPHSRPPQLAGPYTWSFTTIERQAYEWMEFYLLSRMPRTTKTLVRFHAYPCRVCGGHRLSPITALPTAKPRIMWLVPLR
jgi:hypothetical protein